MTLIINLNPDETKSKKSEALRHKTSFPDGHISDIKAEEFIEL